MSLSAVRALSVEEWQAWSWRVSTDEGGLRGVQRLLALLVAVQCSTSEDPVDWREVAPWLAPGYQEFRAAELLRRIRRRAPELLRRFRGRRLREEFERLFPDG